MRRHRGLSLSEALHERIGELAEINTDITEQVKRLEVSVNRLFDTEHEAAELVPHPLNRNERNYSNGKRCP